MIKAVAEETDLTGPRRPVDGPRDQWWLVAAAGLAVFMASVDMSIVNVALPVIERDFEIPTSMTEWVVLAYLLPLAGLALPSGRWLDAVGRRPALVFSLSGFALASVAAGLAPGLTRLIGARLVQGRSGVLPTGGDARGHGVGDRAQRHLRRRAGGHPGSPGSIRGRLTARPGHHRT